MPNQSIAAHRNSTAVIQPRSTLADSAWQFRNILGWSLRTLRRWHEEHDQTLQLRSASHSERRDPYAIGLRLPPPSNLLPLY